MQILDFIYITDPGANCREVMDDISNWILKSILTEICLKLVPPFRRQTINGINVYMFQRRIYASPCIN